VDANIVVAIEAGERVGMTHWTRGAEISADQPVAIERMQGEAVDIDAIRGDQRDHDDHARTDQQPLQSRPKGDRILAGLQSLDQRIVK
jgi:hypothetical protein